MRDIPCCFSRASRALAAHETATVLWPPMNVDRT